VTARSILRAPLPAAALIVLSAQAHAAGGEACARAAERAQDLRGGGKLMAAMEELRACVQTSCPEFVRRDCARWQTEVEASLPTVVVRARTREGRDLTAVRVTVDGAAWADGLDGLAKPLDPGEHRFRFETADAPAVEQPVVVREGEKLRAVDVVFATPVPSDAPPAAVTAATPGRGPWPWVLAGVGVAAAGTGAVLGVGGLSDYHGLQDGCGRTGACTSSQVSPVRTRLWVADVALVVGAVSLGVAGWLALRPLPDGAVVQVTGAL
jgi:hypothetical protein